MTDVTTPPRTSAWEGVLPPKNTPDEALFQMREARSRNEDSLGFALKGNLRSEVFIPLTATKQIYGGNRLCVGSTIDDRQPREKVSTKHSKREK